MWLPCFVLSHGEDGHPPHTWPAHPSFPLNRALESGTREIWCAWLATMNPTGCTLVEKGTVGLATNFYDKSNSRTPMHYFRFGASLSQRRGRNPKEEAGVLFVRMECKDEDSMSAWGKRVNRITGSSQRPLVDGSE